VICIIGAQPSSCRSRDAIADLDVRHRVGGPKSGKSTQLQNIIKRFDIKQLNRRRCMLQTCQQG
jgi:hypothetical protein